MIVKLLKLVDIFPIKPKLYFNNEDRLKTVFGGVLSLLSFLLIIGSGFYLFINIFKRNKYSIIFSVDSSDPKESYMNSNPLIFALWNQNISLNIDKIITIKGITHSQKNLSLVHSSSNPIEPCDEDDLNENTKNFLKMYTNERFLAKYCIGLKDYETTIIKGTNRFGEMNFFELNIDKCKNTTLNTGLPCYTEDEIKDILWNSKLYILYNNSIVNHSSIDSPISNQEDYEEFNMDPTNLRRVLISRKQISYSTDYGYIFQDIREVKKFHDEFFSDEGDIVPKTETIMSFSIKMSKKNEKYIRTYAKLADAANTLISFIKVVMLTGQISMVYFHDDLFYQKFVHKIFFPQINSIQTIFKNSNITSASTNNRFASAINIISHNTKPNFSESCINKNKLFILKENFYLNLSNKIGISNTVNNDLKR